MSGDTLSVRDNRTGQQGDIPIQSGTIRAMDLRKFKQNPDDFGLMTYDPGYTNTAACRSKITFIDGDKGILLYRGYPIEQLAESFSYLEVVQLILNGELPGADDNARFADQIAEEAELPAAAYRIIEAFDPNAHPMGMLTSVVAALSTCYPEAAQVGKPENRRRQAMRLIAKVPVIAAAGYRRRNRLPFVKPSRERSFAGNFLHMMFDGSPSENRIHPSLERALDVLFTLHADHEQNCSTSAMRAIGSSRPDPYLAAAGAIAALAGPLHGGANEAVLDMLRDNRRQDAIPEHIRKVKSGEGRLMGFGHRVYKNYDPRAKIIKRWPRKCSR